MLPTIRERLHFMRWKVSSGRVKIYTWVFSELQRRILRLLTYFVLHTHSEQALWYKNSTMTMVLIFDLVILAFFSGGDANACRSVLCRGRTRTPMTRLLWSRCLKTGDPLYTGLIKARGTFQLGAIFDRSLALWAPASCTISAFSNCSSQFREQ